MPTYLFQLLDVTHEVKGLDARIVIWGRTNDGERVVFFYRGFNPYFYAILEPDASPEAVASAIRSLSIAKSPIVSIEYVEKKYFGRKVDALKITTKIPEQIREYYSRKVAKIKGVARVLEDDIRYAMRFLIDKNLYPMRWYSVEAERVDKPDYRVPAFEVTGEFEEEPLGETSDPLEGLRVLAFDTEIYNKYGSPTPERDPIIIIGIAYGVYGEESYKIEIMDQEKAGGEKELIEWFRDRILELDPDIIVGYNQNHFDWQYLMERARRLAVKLDVGRRLGSEPALSVYAHVSIAGRLNVDLYDYAEEIPGLRLKTLEEVAEYLGVVKSSERVLIPFYEIANYWESRKKRPILLQYAKDDVVSTYELSRSFLPFGAQLSSITGLPMDQLMAASTGFRLEWRLIREAYKRGELVPGRVEKKLGTYVGALVLKPRPGIHENVAVLDFASMYPHIMVKYNVGPDTLIRPGEKFEGPIHVAPETGHKFRAEPKGFFAGALRRFLEWRKRIKAFMKGLQPGTPQYRLLDARQRAVKVLANAMYGYMGWSGARWYCRECAEAVTAWGRMLISETISYARRIGLKVYYGDTDSLFVDMKDDLVEKVMEHVEKMGFEVKIDKIYKRVLFTGAKKRYAGLTMDERIDVVGLEAVRTDWCELAKEVQLNVLDIILRQNNLGKAIEYVRKVIADLRERRIPLAKLIIWKTLTRKIEDYKVEGPHVKAAQIMVKHGFKVEPGMKIGYVIVRGIGKLSDRGMPYFMVSPEEVDVEYYIRKQVVPAAMRILEPLGVDEKKILSMGPVKKRTLTDFF